MQARRQQQSLPPSPKVRQLVSPLLGADALPGANPDRVALKKSPLHMIFAGNVYFLSLLIEQNLQLYCCFYFKNK